MERPLMTGGWKVIVIALLVALTGCGGQSSRQGQGTPEIAATGSSRTTPAPTRPPEPTSSSAAASSDLPAATTSPATADDAPPGPASTSPDPASEPREITGEQPLRVWVIGDSLAGPLGGGLQALTAEILPVEIVVDHAGGTGLARPDLFDWPEVIASRLGVVAPDAVVVHVGTNDAQWAPTPTGWVPFGTPEWIAHYEAIVGSTMDRILGGATRLYWVGAPITASTAFNADLAVINGIFADGAARRGAVRYVDAFAVFQDEEGGYAAVLPGPDGTPLRVRDADGVHYTPEGALRLARHVLGIVAAEWRLGEGGT